MWPLRQSHKHVNQNTLSEYLDGRLQGRNLERVEQQLGECDACRLELEELQATVAMMRQLPMEPPRRSFVMSAPPPIPAQARPALFLRAPSWVYAGAASVAALALAVTVSVDATGGLSSDPLRRQDVAVTTPSSVPTSEQAIATSATTAESASEIEDDEAAPPSLAAAAPASATADQTTRQGMTGGGAPGGGAALATSAPPVATPAPFGILSPARTPTTPATPVTIAAAAQSIQDADATIIVEPAMEIAVAEPASTSAAQDTRVADGDASPTETRSARENEAAKSQPVEAPVPISEPAEVAMIDEVGDGNTSIWWRVLEAAAGLLALAFLAGALLRWRANRRDSA